MQDCYPADARCFFDTRDENVLASHLLDFARIRWPLLFRDDTRAGMPVTPLSIALHTHDASFYCEAVAKMIVRLHADMLTEVLR